MSKQREVGSFFLLLFLNMLFSMSLRQEAGVLSQGGATTGRLEAAARGPPALLAKRVSPLARAPQESTRGDAGPKGPGAKLLNVHSFLLSAAQMYISFEHPSLLFSLPPGRSLTGQRQEHKCRATVVYARLNEWTTVPPPPPALQSHPPGRETVTSLFCWAISIAVVCVPFCHTHVLALLSHYFESVTCVYPVIFSLQRRCTGCRVPFSDPRCFLPVTVYGTTHAHLVHMCWPLLWGLEIPLQPPPPPLGG